MPYALGRLPDDPSKPKLDLTPHLMAAGVDWSNVPATADWLAGDYATGWEMLGNDSAGDCVAVRWANSRRMMTGEYPSSAKLSTQAMVWKVYETQAKDFDPNGTSEDNGPGSDSDTGMATDVLCDYLHKTGGPDGVKMVAYGTVDPSNETAVERAIAVFGSVWADIVVLDGNQHEFDEGKDWTNDGSAEDGGHAVLVGAATPRKKFVTWASVAEFAEDFWTGTAHGDRLVESVYVPIWPEHANDSLFLKLDRDAIAADYQALTGKTLVWPADPTPDPSGDSSSTALAAALRAWEPTILSRITKAGKVKAAGDAWMQAHGL